MNYRFVFLIDLPKRSDRIKRIMKMKKRILAILTAPAAIPPNPNKAATRAIIRNVTVQRNITKILRLLNEVANTPSLKISCQYLKQV
jgi:hypothetical protein